jgi:hypothetical protein
METANGFVQLYTRESLKKLISVLDLEDVKIPTKKYKTYIVFPIPNEYSTIEISHHTTKMPNGKTIYKVEFVKRVILGKKGG